MTLTSERRGRREANLRYRQGNLEEHLRLLSTVLAMIAAICDPSVPRTGSPL